MLSDIGRTYRLNRMRNPAGFYFFLAADHRLANGCVHELVDMASWISLVSDCDGISGVVLNPGSIRHIPADFKKEFIPQLMGNPARGNGSLEKVPIGTIVEAVRAGANLVSLQVNFEDDSMARQVETFSAMRAEAHSYGVPVLAMVNLGNRNSFDFSRFADYVVYASELGSDLIKVNLPNDACDNVESIRSMLRHLPPMLLSGDALSGKYLETVQLSKTCGFSGLCIGRNIFKNEDPVGVVRASCAIYETAS